MPVLRKNSKNILFIHIPKAGGSTIEELFSQSGFERFYFDGSARGTINPLRRCPPQHMHAALLSEVFQLDRFDFKFMIVRDPIARFKSEYIWRNRKKPDTQVDATTVETWAHTAFADYRKNPYHFDNHIRPQADFYVPGAEIYYLEDGLKNVIRDLSRRFSLDVQSESLRVNSGEEHFGHSSSDVQISKSLELRLRTFYRRDYEQFGYNADGAPHQVQPSLRTRAKRSIASFVLKWAER